MKPSKAFRDLDPNDSTETYQGHPFLGDEGSPQDRPIPPGSPSIPLVEEYSPHKLRGQVTTYYPDGTVVTSNVDDFPSPSELIEYVLWLKDLGKRGSAFVMYSADKV